MNAFLPSEIARLILGYLKDESCFETYRVFLSESIYLSEYATLLRRGQQYPTNVYGLSLINIIDQFVLLKNGGNTLPTEFNSSNWCVSVLPSEPPSKKPKRKSKKKRVISKIKGFDDAFQAVLSDQPLEGQSTSANTQVSASGNEQIPVPPLVAELVSTGSNIEVGDNSVQPSTSRQGAGTFLSLLNDDRTPPAASVDCFTTELNYSDNQLRTPKRKKHTPRKRSMKKHRNSNSNESTSIIPEKVSSVVERMLADKTLQEKLAETINKVVNDPHEGGSTAVTSESPSLEEFLTKQEMTSDDITNVIQVAKLDPAFDALFSWFEIDTNTTTCESAELIDQQPATPVAPSGEIIPVSITATPRGTCFIVETINGLEVGGHMAAQVGTEISEMVTQSTEITRLAASAGSVELGQTSISGHDASEKPASESHKPESYQLETLPPQTKDNSEVVSETKQLEYSCVLDTQDAFTTIAGELVVPATVETAFNFEKFASDQCSNLNSPFALDSSNPVTTASNSDLSFAGLVPNIETNAESGSLLLKKNLNSTSDDSIKLTGGSIINTRSESVGTVSSVQNQSFVVPSTGVAMSPARIQSLVAPSNEVAMSPAQNQSFVAPSPITVVAQSPAPHHDIINSSYVVPSPVMSNNTSFVVQSPRTAPSPAYGPKSPFVTAVQTYSSSPAGYRSNQITPSIDHPINSQEQSGVDEIVTQTQAEALIQVMSPQMLSSVEAAHREHLISQSPLIQSPQPVGTSSQTDAHFPVDRCDGGSRDKWNNAPSTTVSFDTEFIEEHLNRTIPGEENLTAINNNGRSSVSDDPINREHNWNQSAHNQTQNPVSVLTSGQSFSGTVNNYNSGVHPQVNNYIQEIVPVASNVPLTNIGHSNNVLGTVASPTIIILQAAPVSMCSPVSIATVPMIRNAPTFSSVKKSQVILPASTSAVSNVDFKVGSGSLRGLNRLKAPRRVALTPVTSNSPRNSKFVDSVTLPPPPNRKKLKKKKKTVSLLNKKNNNRDEALVNIKTPEKFIPNLTSSDWSPNLKALLDLTSPHKSAEAFNGARVASSGQGTVVLNIPDSQPTPRSKNAHLCAKSLDFSDRNDKRISKSSQNSRPNPRSPDEENTNDLVNQVVMEVANSCNDNSNILGDILSALDIVPGDVDLLLSPKRPPGLMAKILASPKISKMSKSLSAASSGDDSKYCGDIIGTRNLDLLSEIASLIDSPKKVAPTTKANVTMVDTISQRNTAINSVVSKSKTSQIKPKGKCMKVIDAAIRQATKQTTVMPSVSSGEVSRVSLNTRSRVNSDSSDVSTQENKKSFDNVKKQAHFISVSRKNDSNCDKVNTDGKEKVVPETDAQNEDLKSEGTKCVTASCKISPKKLHNQEGSKNEKLGSRKESENKKTTSIPVSSDDSEDGLPLSRLASLRKKEKSLKSARVRNLSKSPRKLSKGAASCGKKLAEKKCGRNRKQSEDTSSKSLSSTSEVEDFMNSVFELRLSQNSDCGNCSISEEVEQTLEQVETSGAGKEKRCSQVPNANVENSKGKNASSGLENASKTSKPGGSKRMKKSVKISNVKSSGTDNETLGTDADLKRKTSFIEKDKKASKRSNSVIILEESTCCKSGKLKTGKNEEMSTSSIEKNKKASNDSDIDNISKSSATKSKKFETDIKSNENLHTLASEISMNEEASNADHVSQEELANIVEIQPSVIEHELDAAVASIEDSDGETTKSYALQMLSSYGSEISLNENIDKSSTSPRNKEVTKNSSVNKEEPEKSSAKKESGASKKNSAKSGAYSVGKFKRNSPPTSVVIRKPTWFQSNAQETDKDTKKCANDQEMDPEIEDGQSDESVAIDEGILPDLSDTDEEKTPAEFVACSSPKKGKANIPWLINARKILSKPVNIRDQKIVEEVNEAKAATGSEEGEMVGNITESVGKTSAVVESNIREKTREDSNFDENSDDLGFELECGIEKRVKSTPKSKSKKKKSKDHKRSSSKKKKCSKDKDSKNMEDRKSSKKDKKKSRKGMSPPQKEKPKVVKCLTSDSESMPSSEDMTLATLKSLSNPLNKAKQSLECSKKSVSSQEKIIAIKCLTSDSDSILSSEDMSLAVLKMRSNSPSKAKQLVTQSLEHPGKSDKDETSDTVKQSKPKKHTVVKSPVRNVSPKKLSTVAAGKGKNSDINTNTSAKHKRSLPKCLESVGLNVSESSRISSEKDSSHSISISSDNENDNHEPISRKRSKSRLSLNRMKNTKSNTAKRYVNTGSVSVDNRLDLNGSEEVSLQHKIDVTNGSKSDIFDSCEVSNQSENDKTILEDNSQHSESDSDVNNVLQTSCLEEFASILIRMKRNMSTTMKNDLKSAVISSKNEASINDMADKFQFSHSESEDNGDVENVVHTDGDISEEERCRISKTLRENKQQKIRRSSKLKVNPIQQKCVNIAETASTGMIEAKTTAPPSTGGRKEFPQTPKKLWTERFSGEQSSESNSSTTMRKVSFQQTEEDSDVSKRLLQKSRKRPLSDTERPDVKRSKKKHKPELESI